MTDLCSTGIFRINFDKLIVVIVAEILLNSGLVKRLVLLASSFKT